MSSPDRVFGPLRFARPILALALAPALVMMALALPACTVSPLYGSSNSDGGLPAGPGAALAAVRGRISVALANDRTGQVFRNALLFRLNGSATPSVPLYDVRYVALGTETIVSIQQGSGIPSASSYRMSVTYQLIRLSDTKEIASGTRFGTAPFDRTQQLFASERALLDAREQAGEEAAERVAFAIAAAIRKDLKS